MEVSQLLGVKCFICFIGICYILCTQSLLSKCDINKSEELKTFLGYESDPSIAFARRRSPTSLPRIDKVCSSNWDPLLVPVSYNT